MKSTLKHRVLLFAGMSSLHLCLYQSIEHFSDAFGGAVLFLSWSPWLPLAWAGIAVKTYLFPVPTGVGLLWCATVWLVLYWFAAAALEKLAGRFSQARARRAA